jgi:hypothetical protein
MRIDLFHLGPAVVGKPGRVPSGSATPGHGAPGHGAAGSGHAPSLIWLQAGSFEDITPGTVKQQVEKRFRDLIAGNPKLPSIVVIAPSMGDSGGEIIAAEMIRAESGNRSWTSKSTRELVWLTDPATGIQ